MIDGGFGIFFAECFDRLEVLKCGWGFGGYVELWRAEAGMSGHVSIVISLSYFFGEQ